MRTLGYSIIHLVQLIRFFGFSDGLRIYFQAVLAGEKSVISIHPRKFRNPVLIRMGASDYPIFLQVFGELQYDIKFFLDYQPKTIIDAGSNVGYSLLYFSNQFPDAKIIGIEPEAGNFRQLQSNTRGYPDITAVNAGIWHSNVALNIKNEKEWSASFEVEENASSHLKGLTIDAIASMNGFDYIDILKIDIEGSEYGLFANDPHSWLSKTRCLIIELHDQLVPGTSQVFFREMSKYRWRTFIKGENIVCFRDYSA